MEKSKKNKNFKNVILAVVEVKEEYEITSQVSVEMEKNLKRLTGYNIPVLQTQGIQSITFIKKET